ncbi:MAG: hypothetical protein IKR74_04100 [Bacilli bacterium]|nr:hypothetical protein [Bacilli bacterium]
MWDNLSNNNPNNKFLKVVANKKIRSAIGLLFWVIAIGIIYIMVVKPLNNYSVDNSNNTNNETTNEVVEISFDAKKQALLNNNYSYIFKYNDSEVYKGDLLGNKTTGYSENSDGIKRYYIENDKAYFVNFGVLSEATYDERINTFFNVSYIFDLIKDNYPIIVDNVYNYKIEENYIKIIVDDENIRMIEISWNEDTYVLEFSNIGKITSIEY